MRSLEITAFNSKGQQACLCVFLPVQEICGDLDLTRNIVYQNISSSRRGKKGFPRGPLVQTPLAQHTGCRFHPWSGNNDPHAGQCSQKKERGKEMEGLCNRVLPKNWIYLLVGVKPKDTTKPEIRRRKNLLLFAASKDNTRDLSQSSVFLSMKIREVLS